MYNLNPVSLLMLVDKMVDNVCARLCGTTAKPNARQLSNML